MRLCAFFFLGGVLFLLGIHKNLKFRRYPLVRATIFGLAEEVRAIGVRGGSTPYPRSQASCQNLLQAAVGAPRRPVERNRPKAWLNEPLGMLQDIAGGKCAA